MVYRVLLYLIGTLDFGVSFGHSYLLNIWVLLYILVQLIILRQTGRVSAQYVVFSRCCALLPISILQIGLSIYRKLNYTIIVLSRHPLASRHMKSYLVSKHYYQQICRYLSRCQFDHLLTSGLRQRLRLLNLSSSKNDLLIVIAPNYLLMQAIMYF